MIYCEDMMSIVVTEIEKTRKIAYFQIKSLLKKGSMTEIKINYM